MNEIIMIKDNCVFYYYSLKIYYVRIKCLWNLLVAINYLEINVLNITIAISAKIKVYMWKEIFNSLL